MSNKPDEAVLQHAFAALQAKEWRLAENYLRLLPLEVQSSARAAVILYRNEFARMEQDDANNTAAALLAALIREVDHNRSGKPVLYAPAETKKSLPMQAETKTNYTH